jgi:hypothetical protein
MYTFIKKISHFILKTVYTLVRNRFWGYIAVYSTLHDDNYIVYSSFSCLVWWVYNIHNLRLHTIEAMI